MSFAQSDAQLRSELLRAQERILELEGRLASDLPPASADGQCFARVLVAPPPSTYTETIEISAARTETIIIPAVTETVSAEVVASPERIERRIIPAVYDTVTEQVMVAPERVERTLIPATYRTITETITIEESRVEPVVIPAQYETYTEQVLVRDAYTTWQPSEPLFASANTGDPDAETFARRNFSARDLRELPTGEILCRVEVPAEYQTVTRTRLVAPERIVYRTATGGTSESPVTLPARTETITRQELITPEQINERVIPAEYETVTRVVLVQPETIEEITIPAVYESRMVERIVTPAREETTVIPAVTETYTRTSYSGDGNLAWREVLCEINTTPDAIRQIQIGLRDAGYNPGPVDGIFDALTYDAMVRYQEANGLVSGQLTRAFVEHLDVPWAPLTVNFYPTIE
ncbi:peptidoglycan-binding domain-containing protein [Maricaulis sp.]|uniref:peptidoglycan-binding domain-containing protein n=1 Tax=Maricaulis sp. TaxID=1486257 RepID=UPI002B27BA36|nr:peptidoglycan-binding domain-containing protein [Maricaulis sp.]